MEKCNKFFNFGLNFVIGNSDEEIEKFISIVAYTVDSRSESVRDVSGYYFKKDYKYELPHSSRDSLIIRTLFNNNDDLKSFEKDIIIIDELAKYNGIVVIAPIKSFIVNEYVSPDNIFYLNNNFIINSKGEKAEITAEHVVNDFFYIKGYEASKIEQFNRSEFISKNDLASIKNTIIEEVKNYSYIKSIFHNVDIDSHIDVLEGNEYLTIHLTFYNNINHECNDKYWIERKKFSYLIQEIILQKYKNLYLVSHSLKDERCTMELLFRKMGRGFGPKPIRSLY